MPTSYAPSNDGGSPIHHSTAAAVTTPPASPRLTPRPFMTRATSWASSSASTAQLQDRFAELRDAIYFSSPTPGFILSADERFAYPNYQVNQPPEEPVEIDDVEAYFRERWDCWDEHFTRRLDLDEYPVIRLSRERKNFNRVRVGLLSPEGKRILFEARGECAYALGTRHFLGGVTYFTELGVYEDVLSHDRERALSCFETICDYVPHMVWTCSMEGVVDYFSKSFYDYTGLTPEQSLGFGWRNVIHPEDTQASWDSIDQMTRATKDQECQMRYLRHDGVYRWHSLRGRPIKDEYGKVLKWYGTSTDIHDFVTAREAAKKLEAENHRLLTLEHAARESNRLKSQFLAHMSHELRTPIAGIMGMVNLLQDTKLAAEQKEYADCIKVSAGNLLTIVNDILDFSKIESGQLHIEQIPFSVTSAIDEVARQWTYIAQQKGIAFNVESHVPKDVELVGDPMRIGQILSNLCSNAIKFTGNGSIHLSTRFVERENGIALQIEVKDTGIGIHADVLGNLFTPFRQGDTSTARLFGGTGLGLIISRNLAQLMGGQLHLESSFGQGTTAIVHLPAKTPELSSGDCSPTTVSRRPSLALQHLITPTPPVVRPRKVSELPGRQTLRRVQTEFTHVPSRRLSLFALSPTPTNEEAAESVIPKESRKGVTVLIVEDNPINQRIAIKTAEKLGFVTKAASNGQEALEFLVRGINVDIVLMDCQMPILDGYEATRLLRNEEPYCSIQLPEKDEACWTASYATEKRMLRDIPVIALTASAIPGDKEKCHDAGMDDYLTKPLDPKQLERKLVKWAFGRGRLGSLPV